MNKTKQLNQLFNKWRKNNFEIFCEDGIINEEIYHQQPIKVLFVLKDFHLKYDLGTYKKAGYIDLRQHVCSEGGMWYTISSWSQAVLDSNSKENVLEKIAFLNLKKEHGEASVGDDCIMAYAKQDTDWIQQEIKIINPDVIIACSNASYHGLQNIFKDYLTNYAPEPDAKINFHSRMSHYGDCFDIKSFFEKEKPVYVIHYRHPNQCGKQGTVMEHCENMLKIREFVLKNIETGETDDV